MDIPNKRVGAIRLLKALVAAVANADAPMPNAWIQAKALEIASLEGDEFLSTLQYAGEQGWIDNSGRAGWTSLTGVGETVVKSS